MIDAYDDGSVLETVYAESSKIIELNKTEVVHTTIQLRNNEDLILRQNDNPKERQAKFPTKTPGTK